MTSRIPRGNLKSTDIKLHPQETAADHGWHKYIMVKSFNEYIKENLDDLKFADFDELKEYLETEIYNLVMDWYICAAEHSSAKWTEEEAETVTSKLIDTFRQNKHLL